MGMLHHVYDTADGQQKQRACMGDEKHQRHDSTIGNAYSTEQRKHRKLSNRTDIANSDSLT